MQLLQTTLPGRIPEQSGIPILDAARAIRISGQLFCRRAIHFRDKRRRVLVEKSLDPIKGYKKTSCELRKRSLADDDQQHHLMPCHGGPLIWFVANATIVGKCHPLPPSYILQPYLIGAGGRKEISMPPHVQSTGAENFRKLLAQVAIGEIDPAQAARS